MKSAYELAMERMEAASGPTKRLSDEAKAQIAEIDSKCDGDIAALRIDLDAKLATATSHEEFGALKDELAQGIQRIEARREQEKDAVWEEA